MSARLTTLRRLAAETPYSLIANLYGPLGFKLRYLYWKARLRHLGDKVIFGLGVQIFQPQYVSIGDNCWIDNNVALLAGTLNLRYKKIIKENKYFHGEPGELSIGRNVHLSLQSAVQAHAGVSIGDNCGVAAGGRIYSVSNHYQHPDSSPPPGDRFSYTPLAPDEKQCVISSPCVMQDDTGLAVNALMLPGSTIREGTWVGVGAMVVGELPGDCIAGGVPAKVLKERPRC